MGKKRIGILTGGGDCPGLNTVIRGVAKAAMNLYGTEVLGFEDGFLGMIENRFVTLTDEKVSGILTQGGTILGSTNRADPFRHYTEDNGSSGQVVDLSDKCVDLYNILGLSALICIGGDGTMTIAGRLAEKGINVIGVPKTIDNDLFETDVTFGFDSAVTTATEAIDKIHTTADSHHRVMFVEVMGRNAGWLALDACVAGGGDVVLIPEIPYDLDEVLKAIKRRRMYGKRFSIVVVAEGAKPVGGDVTCQRYIKGLSEPLRLGGCSHVIADQVEKASGIECRVTVLGHLQRGGTPTPRDRLLATMFAVKAVELFGVGSYNCMVGLRGADLIPVPIEKVVGRQRRIPVNSPKIKTALALGTSFGWKDPA